MLRADFDPFVWARRYGVRQRTLRRRLYDACRGRRRFDLSLLVMKSQLVDGEAELGAPRSWTWEILPYPDDPWARQFVQEHPEGATLEEVAQALGMSRERVRQIEEEALTKLTDFDARARRPRRSHGA